MKSNGKLIWHNEKRKLKDLTPFEHNPRQLTEKQYADLKKSLEKFDLAEVPAINTDNTICAGHQRLKILSDLYGLEHEVDVRVPNRKLTKKEFEEYNIRSNKNTGEWDMDILANNFEIPDLLDYGFTEKELDLDLWNDKTEEELDEVPEVQKEAISKLGDLFELGGKHRILCGDATNEGHVSDLCGELRANLIFTDPPYAVNYGIENAILNSSQNSDIVMDVFLGSGSTLIASEQTDRTFLGCELDPIYIDVILRRYHKLYPNKEIKCLNRSFDFGKLFNA